MNIFIIPANSKSGKLIFNIFRPFDLILASVGLVVSVLLILIIAPKSLLTAIITSELLITLEKAYCLFVRTNSLYIPKLNSGFSFLISPKSCN